jgi:hypothetical protein
MLARFAFFTAVSAVVLFGVTQSVQASGACREHSKCYQKVHTPAVYSTVAHPVVVEPARHQIVHMPAVVGTRTQRIELHPGAWTSHHRPAEYGQYTKSVVVHPARVSHTYVPARTTTVFDHVVVRKAATRWEHSVDRHGRETKCKVHIPAETRRVARQVEISPAHTVAHSVPAVYKTVTQPVLVSPAKTVHSYSPPVHDYVAHPVVLRPASSRVVIHPPVIGVAHKRELILEGGTKWQPVSERHW